MYNIKEITNCLFGLIGFRQTDNPDYPTLSNALVQTDSGLYIQDEHPLLNIENIDQALKNYDSFSYPAYDSLTIYKFGEIVTFSGQKYQSLIGNNQGNQPDISAEWEVVDVLSQKLTGLIKSSINKALTKVFNMKKLRRNTKAVFDNVYLFDGVGRLSDKELKKDRFVGVSFQIKQQNDLAAIIKRIGLQFSAPNPDFNLYLFHTSRVDPIKIFTYSLNGTGSFEWQAQEDYQIKYNQDDLDVGGLYLLGYYEEDLAGQAIIKRYRWDITPQCTTCNKDYQYFQKYSQYLDFTPISVSSSAIAGIKPSDPGGAKLFDVGKMAKHYDTNFGINMELAVQCDLTDFFCKNKDMFVDVTMKSLAVDLLQEIAFSTRNNVISKETRIKAMYELDNRENNSLGKKAEYEKAVKAVDVDLSDLNSVCLPCLDRWAPNTTRV